MGLVISETTKRFGEKVAVNRLGFSFDAPGVFGLLGTNGAGKTTTIRMILGILAQDEGSILWNGKPAGRESARFGYLPEERGLYPKITVSDQLLYFARLRGLSMRNAKKSMDRWLSRLRVEEYKNKPAEQLSKGNQQKIQLIAALIHDPELIIMDEPFSGLDPINTDLFKSVIQELVADQRYIIMSSHQMSTVEQYCREIVLLKDGETLLEGNLKEIKKGYGRTRLSVDCEGDILPQAGELGIALREKTPFGYEFQLSSDEQAYRLLERILAAGVRLDRFEIREPSLHEIFVEKAGEAS